MFRKLPLNLYIMQIIEDNRRNVAYAFVDFLYQDNHFILMPGFITKRGLPRISS